MGLTCSLFGHEYADGDVERERADHGAEVVTTVRVTETCRRCGHARVVSENTEVVVGTPPNSTAGERGRSSEGTGTEATEAETAEVESAGTEPVGTALTGNGHAGTEADSIEVGDTKLGPNDGASGSADAHGEAGSIDIEDEEERSDSQPTAAAATRRSLAESELRCRGCEFSEAVLGSALRAGDSCPACSRGYLVRRTRKG
jgi:hypothetical protein